MNNCIRLVIADDHELVLDGLRSLFDGHKDIEVVGTATDGDLLLEITSRLSPDVVLTDIRMPVLNGIEATKYILQNKPSMKVLALSMLDNDHSIMEMLEAGALGYIVKNSSKEQIVNAIYSVYGGVPYFCEYTTPLLARLIAQSKFDPYRIKQTFKLNEREKTIIKLLCKEKTAQEIAKELFLSVKTVEWYRLNLLKKLEARNLAGIIIYAIRPGIVEI